MGACIKNFSSNQKLVRINAHYTQTVLHHYDIAKACPKDALHRTSYYYYYYYYYYDDDDDDDDDDVSVRHFVNPCNVSF